MPNDCLYPIGDVARRTGLAVSAIRYYSDEGIVAPTGTTAAGTGCTTCTNGFRGTMEFLIASAALELKDEGVRFLSLSGAPLAGWTGVNVPVCCSGC
jgi:hypothetical protein